AGTHVAVSGAGLAGDTDASGKFSIAGVAPGTYSLEVTRASYESAVIAGVMVSLDQGGGTVQVPALLLHLARGSVAGRVLLEGEASSAGATVALSGIDGSVQTGADGSYLISGVPEGSYNLTAGKFAFQDGSAANIQVTGGATARVPDLTLSANP